MVALVAGVSGLTVSMRGHHEKGQSNWATSIFQRYTQAFVSVQHKVDALKHAVEDNEKLRAENSHLRMVLESERYAKYAEKAQKATQVFQWKLTKDAGSRTGRTIASIGYRVPTDLVPSQLLTLGMSYFKTRDDEKAAVILTFLTGMEGDETYKTPANYLATAVAWYRLDNYELADFYFDQVLHSQDSPATKKFMGQARLWKGLVSERTGKHTKAQFWLHEVMDHDPRSVEAHWVNQGEVKREPAQERPEGSSEEQPNEHGEQTQEE